MDDERSRTKILKMSWRYWRREEMREDVGLDLSIELVWLRPVCQKSQEIQNLYQVQEARNDQQKWRGKNTESTGVDLRGTYET